MNDWANDWVDGQMFRYRIEPRGFAARFAGVIAFKAVAVAEVGMASVHILLNLIGLNAAPLWKALFVGTLVTVPVAALVSLVISYSVGRAIQALAISRDEFERLSATDLLSGLANRRAFFQRVEDMREDAALALFDIDRFKRINDTYGHVAGDEVIRGVARILSSVFAGDDTAIGRLGGEEFAVLLRRRVDDGHVALVDKARAAIADARIELATAASISVTVSAGVADLGGGRETLEAYRLSDQALYCAKAAGRNRVVHERDLAALLAAKRRPPRPQPSPEQLASG